MAREYAKPFYRSKEWQACRDAYFMSKGGICELCGKPGEEVHHKTFITPTNIHDQEVTLNWTNLQLLCRTCHVEIHKTSYKVNRRRKNENRGLRNDLEFDEDGNIVERKNVFIVWGAPASGKSQYVKEHKGEHDMVVDLDLLMTAIGGGKRSEDLLKYAFEVRDHLYKLIAERKHYFDACWIIATLPRKEPREKLGEELKAELIHVDTPKSVCLERARKDETRLDKDLQFRIITKFFEQLET